MEGRRRQRSGHLERGRDPDRGRRRRAPVETQGRLRRLEREPRAGDTRVHVAERRPHVDVRCRAGVRSEHLLWGDPSVAIAPDGREYVAFTEKSICAPGPDLTPYLVVGSRAGPSRRLDGPARRAPGGEVRLRRQAGDRGRSGRSRLRRVVAAARPRVPDDGRQLERRRRSHVVEAAGREPRARAAAAGHDRRRRARIGVRRRRRRTRHLGRSLVRRWAELHREARRRASAGQSGRDLPRLREVRPPAAGGPLPRPEPDRHARTRIASSLRTASTAPISRTTSRRSCSTGRCDRSANGPIGSTKKKADQFWPASAVDASTGKLWACFYDTSGDSDRQHAWFTCTSSRDGKRWSTPVRATSESQNQGVLWEDARIAGYGDSGGYGGYVGVAAAGGVAYPPGSTPTTSAATRKRSSRRQCARCPVRFAAPQEAA